MVKKVIIERDDEQKMLDWNEERLVGFREKYNEMDSDDGIYVISIDVASPDSSDASVMCKMKLVDGKYVFDGVVEV